MANKDQLLGWDVSPYTAKVKSYFNFKKIPYDYKPPNAYTLSRKVQPATGKIIMPTVFQANGTVLQDSSVIIDTYEKRFKKPAVIPVTPNQAFASLLVELFADEWLPLAGLHYRWNYPGNYDFIINEFGSNALPYFPKFIQRMAARKFADKMSSYLPVLGITEKIEPELERVTETLFVLLSEHFKVCPFLLGQQPTIGDFALYGFLYAHLERDPEPEDLINKHAQLHKWLMLMHSDFHRAQGELPPNDEIPESLIPVLKFIAKLQAPLLQQTITGVKEWHQNNPDTNKLPQRLGDAELTINGITETRYNLSYSYWMIQRIIERMNEINEGSLSSPNNSNPLKADSLIESLNLADIFLQPLPLKVLLKRARLYRAT